MPELTASLLLDDLTPDEVARAERVERVLPALREHAEVADRDAEFPRSHVARFADAGQISTPLGFPHLPQARNDAQSLSLSFVGISL